jgi:phosphoribosylamine--glycine ligase/phosphoribosylformylglycinamidine cyclo-ligase
VSFISPRITTGLDSLSLADVVVFHAGTTQSGDSLVTSGGRVLAVTAYGLTVQDALDAAYLGVNAISFEGKTFRRDIGHRYVHTLSSITLTK